VRSPLHSPSPFEGARWPEDMTCLLWVEDAVTGLNACRHKWKRVKEVAQAEFESLEALEQQRTRLLRLVERSMSQEHRDGLKSEDAALKKKAQTRRSNDYQRVLRAAFPERFRPDGKRKASVSVMGFHA